MIGRILRNRYEIIELIGSGGMANVYRGRDRMLNRFVAIKVLKPEYKNDQEFIRRFDTESQASASLSHKNIVPIYDVGEQDDCHYIVMEYVEGKTLKEVIKEKGCLYWKEALDFSMQLCEALAHAHSKHIIHRDIKPQNIMVTPDGQLKVMDFGIARAVSASTTKLGDTALGSAHYISPEQARGRYTDARTDIYSLGVVMYEMFTGKLPFDADSPVAIAMQHVQKQPQSPASINPAIPSAIVAIIMKAMSKEQRLRYESAEAMYNDLKAVYIDPEADIAADEEENDAFATRKIPKVKDDDWEEDEIPEYPSRRREIKKKKRKEDRAAVTAAVITSIVVVLAAILIAARVLGLWGAGNPEEIIPDLRGMELSEAQEKYPNYQIVQTETEYDDTYEEGQIISQDPEAKGKAKGVTVIQVVVSMGAETFVLDDYSNMNHIQAKTALNNLGLSVKEEQEESNSYDKDVVIRHSPASGSRVHKGDTVTLYVSSGQSESTTIVPSLLGMSVSQARSLLRQNDLELGNVSSVESDTTKDLIVSQSHSSNSSVEKGTSIDVVISAGKKSSATGAPADVPDSEDEPENQAE